MRKLLKTSLLLLALALFLAGCAGLPSAPGVAEDSPAAAQAAMDRGDYVAAARTYLRLADAPQYSAEERRQFRLEAADALSRSNQPVKALQVLEQVELAQLPPAQQARAQLVQARAWLTLRNSGRVLETLAAPLPSGSDEAAWQDYHQLRAQAYSLQENHLEAAREYARRGRYLRDETAIGDNQQQLWNALSQLPIDTLRTLRVTLPADEFRGWIALAEIGKQYQLSRGELLQLAEEWRRGYPGHPARQQFIDDMLRRSTELVTRPKQIALLLPLSGRFAGAGAAVRDGVLAAYYREPADRRVVIRTYDSAQPTQVQASYEQALQDGADFVIGPLSKEGVAALLQRSEFPVPTLVLNSVDGPVLPDNLYQFSLAPEEEAQQVAEYAWLLGYSHAAVFTPAGEWGERIEQAFAQRWKELGGAVSSQVRYDSSKNDFSDPLRHMLGLTLSGARHQRLQSVVGQKLEFQPRRRADVDFVFLAAFPRQGRLIRPQLRFHHAGDVPVLATSHVYSGAVAREQDRDMDGIVFGDMPWTLNATTPNEGLRRDAAALRVSDNGLQRLIALGADAYQLIPVLRVLESYPFERFYGETGSLRLDTQRRVKRQLTWARFKGGVPQLEESGTAPLQP